MFKIWGSAAVAGSILCALQTATGPPATAFDHRIELTNSTRMAIIEIYAAPVGTGRWEQDLLGDDILAPGASTLLSLRDGIGCWCDLRTVFDDGTSLIRRNINVCEVPRYAISYR
jgi:hypothetical protein